MRISAFVVLAVALVTAPSAAAAPRAARVPPTSLVTDRDRYVVSGLPAMAELEIGLRYTNRSKAPRYFPACHEPTPPLLEKLMHGVWVSAFGPIVRLCRSPAFVMAPGESYSFVFHVAGSLDGSFHPEFTVDEVPGTYRVRWRAYRRSVRDAEDALGFGREEDPEEVISNTFRIVTAAR